MRKDNELLAEGLKGIGLYILWHRFIDAVRNKPNKSKNIRV